MSVGFVVEVLFNQVCDDFRIGFGGELVPFFHQFFLERKIILDDSVVHHHDLAGAIAMRMGIFFGRTSVRGPARVADSIGAIQWLQADGFFQVAQLAFSPPHLQGLAAAIAGYGYAGRVVAAILQTAQAVQNYRYNPLFPNVTNNSAHKNSISYLVNSL